MAYVLSVSVLMKSCRAYEYDGVIDPESMMTWEITWRGSCNVDFTCVNYQNPDTKQVVEAIFFYTGNQRMLLIAYRYDFLGQTYIIMLDEFGNYIQKFPPKTDV